MASSSDSTAVGEESPSEVQILRRQVKSLQTENAKLKKEIAELRKKRPSESSSAGAAPSKKIKTAGQRRKVFEKWAKALQRESKKTKMTNSWGCEPYTVTVKDAGLWTPAEFEALFGGKGTKTQPLPDNKPTSVITILNFADYDEVSELFSGEGAGIPQEGYEVQIWRQRNFQKSYKRGESPSTLESMEVHYNKSKQTLSFQFLMNMADDYY